MERLRKPKLQTIVLMVLLAAGTTVVLASGLLRIAPPWTQMGPMALLLTSPLLLLVGVVCLRKRRISASLVSAVLLSTFLFGILTQVATGVSPPDRYYLNDAATSGISPAGEHMNGTQGTAEATLTFDTVGQTAYWYVDETWPTGSEDFGLAAGNYTFNMYFDELPGPWYDIDWSFRKKITINSTKVSADLTDFPVLIDLASDADLAAGAQNDGDDILFTSSDGATKLNHEIERFNGTTGELVTWVNVTSLSSVSDTVLYMYYGNSTVGSQQNAPGTWGSAFKGIWHLSDDFLDSTSNNNDGTNQGSTDTAGKIADSQNFAGSQWVQVPHSASISITGTQITVSAWVNLSQSQPNDAGVVLKSTSSYEIHLGVETADTGNFRINATGAPASYCRIDTQVLTVGVWYYLTGTYDGSTTRIYLNGTEEATCATQSGNILGNTEPVVIGRRAIGDSRWFYGDIDEPRMIEATRSADWILTEYNNQNSASTFYTVGGEETAWYNSAWSFRKKITIDNTKVSADLTNFPVLINITDTDLRDDAQNDGDDILFTASDGATKLSHEIEHFNGTTGELVAWVNVTSLSSSVDTEIYLYYGNSMATNQENVAGVWDANYVGVWHFNETVGGANSVKDSTSNSNHATDAGGPTFGVAGKIGNALEFDGIDDRAETAVVTHNVGTGDFTWAIWVYPQTYPDAWATAMSNGDFAPGFYPQASTELGIWWTSNRLSGDTVPLDAWTHIAVRRSGDTISFLKNGVQSPTTHTIALSMANAILRFARDNAAGGYHDGPLDEARFSDIHRSTDWISTQYNNQNDTSTFYSVGSEETESNVQITVGVHHTRADGTNPQEIATSSTVTIDANTADPLIVNVGAGAEQVFKASDPRRLRLLVNVTSVSGAERFVLAYNSTANPTHLETPVVGTRPQLVNPTLTPTSGSIATNFNFTIDYRHPDGTPSEAVRVNVSDAANGTYNNFTMSPAQTPELDYFVQQSWTVEGSVSNFANAQSSADSGASAVLVQEDFIGGGGSIAFDAVSSDNTTTSPLTFSHTIGGGSHRLLVLMIGIEAPLGNTTINAVTYNGVSMTLAVQNVTGTSFHMRTAIYYMLDADLPSAGTHTVSITASLADNIQAGAISVTGAAQQAPEATANSGDGQSGDDWIETQITTLTNGAWIFDVVGSGNAVTFTPNSGQTEQFDVTGSSSGTAGGTKEVATAGTETINWTTDTSSNRISHSLAAFAPVSTRLLIQFNTTGIRSSGEDTLVIRYNLTSADDTVGVWVWNFTASSWAQRGTLDQTALSFLNYTLTTDEKSGGVVRIRFNDTSDIGSTDLSIDYQLVNNTLWTTGVTYYLNTTLAAGEYSHYFWANDTNGVSNRTATFAGPSVSAGPVISNFRLENATGATRVGEQLDVDFDYFFLFNVTDPNGWTDIGDDGNVSLRLWYDGDVAATTQRDPTACEAVGSNWTSCTNAFSSGNLYAYANDTGGGGAVLDVALIVGDPAALDPNKDVPLRDHLETTLGHTVTLKDDADSSYDPTTFDVVVISESVGSSSTAWLKTQVVGILTVEGANNDELEMGTGGSSSGGGDTNINITDNTHYITQVFPTGVLTVSISTNNLGSMSGWANDVNKLAHYDSTPTSARLLEVEKGGVLQGGTNTSADRRVFFGAQYFGNLTADGRTLFNRSLDWAAYNTVGGPGKNDTAWKNFGFALGADPISSVEVGVEWFRNNTAPSLNVTVSWDGGTSWATNQTATNKSADDNTLEWLDFTSATTWTPAKLNDANLRVRVGTNASGARLDYVTVRVVTTSELTFGEQTTGANYRIELKYVDMTDPGNASLSEWSVTEGSATYNASASSETEILSGPTTIGYEFKLALKLGFQAKQAADPTNNTAGSYNDMDSWNGEVEANDGLTPASLQTASTGEHMEFGVFMYTNVTVGGDWSATGFRGQTVNSNTITVTYRSNDDFNLTIWFTTHLLKGGDTIDISNVRILAAADLNDNITLDTAFAGLGEANLVYILGTASWFFPHATDANENTTMVQFSVSIPGSQAFGTYTAQLVIKIQQRPSG